MSAPITPVERQYLFVARISLVSMLLSVLTYIGAFICHIAFPTQSIILGNLGNFCAVVSVAAGGYVIRTAQAAATRRLVIITFILLVVSFVLAIGFGTLAAHFGVLQMTNF